MPELQGGRKQSSDGGVKKNEEEQTGVDSIGLVTLQRRGVQ